MDIFSEKNLPEIKGSYRFNVGLANTNWFRVGGNAEILFRPHDICDLIYFLKNKPSMPIYILGVGSNILIRDGGIKGIVIKLGKNFANIKFDKNYIYAGSSALDYNVAIFALHNNFGGLEFLSGIPGTIGGALNMNAGAYGSDISKILIKAEFVTLEGERKIFNVQDIGYKYRGHNLNENGIFTSAYFKYEHSSKEEISRKMEKIAAQRNFTQPVKSRTGGSTFKNPEGFKAWELIDQAGCRGMNIGGAKMSELHCNFLVNEGDATAKNIEDLINLVQKKVFEKTGINLETEIKIIGER